MANIKPHKAMSVANFVVDLALKNDTPVSNLHLQKILYYLQAFYLVQTDGMTPIIDASFSRWPFGPVIKEVYYSYNQFGAALITEVQTYENDPFEEGSQDAVFDEMTAEDLGEYSYIIIPFLKELFKKVPWELVELTHAQKIWDDYKDQIQTYSAPDYKNQEIFEQFQNNVEDQIWNG